MKAENSTCYLLVKRTLAAGCKLYRFRRPRYMIVEINGRHVVIATATL